MSYKLDEDKLMAYVYGELSYEEKKEIDELIKKHPEIQEELDQLKDVRSVLGKLQDKEVIEPVIFHERRKEVPYLKTIMAIAASISFIILVSYLTNLRVSFGDQQLVVQFGETSMKNDTVTDANKSIREFNKQLTASAKQDSESLQKQVDSLKMTLASYANTSEMISRQIEKSLSDNLLATKSQLAAYASEQQKINQQALLSLFNQSEEQQKQYINTLLTDYADYIDGRREQDVQFYIDGLRTIKEDYDLKQIETEQLLANLITTTGQALSGDYRAGSK